MFTQTSELAWAAGFFDGEGHSRSDAKKYGTYIRLDIAQTKSPELLERFHAAVGERGHICGPYNYGASKGHSEWWALRAHGKEVVEIYELLQPFLGSVKRFQFETAIAAQDLATERVAA